MPKPTAYLRPATLEEALEAAARPGALVVNGGALLLNRLDLSHDIVIDLQGLASLRALERRASGLFLGGGLSLQAVVESPLIPSLLGRALRRTLPINHRHATSISDSLLVVPALREWLAALIVTQARLEYAGKEPGVALALWEQPVDEFVTFVYRHGNHYPAIITGLTVPTLPERTGLGSAFVARTPADEPIVNAAAALTLRDDGLIARVIVAIGGATAVPVARFELEELVGAQLDDQILAGASAAIAAQVRPVSDYRGSYDYRVAMAALMTQRALAECREQLA